MLPFSISMNARFLQKQLFKVQRNFCERSMVVSIFLVMSLFYLVCDFNTVDLVKKNFQKLIN